MKSAKRICRKQNCRSFAVEGSGYCSEHKTGRFDDLTRKKEEWKKKFYSSWKWRQKSLSFRKANPFCAMCLPRRTLATLVHHEPSLEELMEEEKDPFDDQYLQALCFNCHQRELKSKRR